MNEENQHIDPLEIDLIRFINGKCTIEESKQISSRIIADNSIRNRYHQLRNSVLAYDNTFLDGAFNPDRAEKKFLDQIEEDSHKAPDIGVNPKSSSLFWIKVAAAILVIMVPGVLFLTSTQKVRIIAENDKLESITLPDNSRVWVNARSELQYPKKFKSNMREANLSGEAYFEIQSEPTNPFYINTTEFTVKVIGTALNIRNYANDTSASVSVKEGKVEIYMLNGDLLGIVSTGEHFSMNKHTKQWSVTGVNNDNYQAWKTGVLEFRDTRLAEAVQMIGSHYNTPIYILDDSLHDKLIYSTFDNESIDAVLEILGFIHNLSIEKKDSAVFISSSIE